MVVIHLGCLLRRPQLCDTTRRIWARGPGLRMHSIVRLLASQSQMLHSSNSYPRCRSSVCCRSRFCCRFKFMAIIRHERFSRRSELGSCPLVFAYSRQICAPSGSFLCISSGLSSGSIRAASSFQVSKNDSRNKPLWASPSVGDKSSLVGSVSNVDVDVSEAMALEEPDVVS